MGLHEDLAKASAGPGGSGPEIAWSRVLELAERFEREYTDKELLALLAALAVRGMRT